LDFFNAFYILFEVWIRVVNETYDAETETSVPPVRDETFGRDIQAVTSH